MQTRIWHQEENLSNCLHKLSNETKKSRFIEAETAKEEVGIGILWDSSGKKKT